MDKQFDSNLYRAIQAQNDPSDVYKNADTERKLTYLAYQESCKSLDNANTCALLSQNLDKITNSVYKDGENIYNKLLHEKFIGLNVPVKLDPNKKLNIDLESCLKDLECTPGQKFYCHKSEQGTKEVLDDFLTIFRPKTKQHLKAVEDSKCKQMSFLTARDVLDAQQVKIGSAPVKQTHAVGLRRTVKSKFVSPLIARNSSEEKEKPTKPDEQPVDDRLKNIDPKIVELIKAEIMDNGPSIGWDDIAGLEFAKSAIKEAVVWPLLRPDIFTGLRRPPKGILLFGPPGTGKTLIGKCVASQSKSTFFSISASSLTSKWVGEGEKMVRALFQVARVHQPAVIFIDEVDSLLTQRSDTEHESSRRIKTEFLVQLDGATTNSEDRLLVIGATNRPQELDEAARRRFVKRLYIPLPEYQARMELLTKLLVTEKHSLSEVECQELAKLLDGYSGADVKNLCSEAALEPIRSIDFENIEKMNASELRGLNMEDFRKALKTQKASVSQEDLVHYLKWDKTYGSGISR